MQGESNRRVPIATGFHRPETTFPAIEKIPFTRSVCRNFFVSTSHPARPGRGTAQAMARTAFVETPADVPAALGSGPIKGIPILPEI